MKVGFADVGKPAEIIEIEPDENGSYLSVLQDLVGGLIDYFDVLFDSKPAFVINDEGMFTCDRNRMIVATKEMEERGYLSLLPHLNGREPGEIVREGDYYTILFGPIVAISSEWDEDGNEIQRDITPEEFEAFCQATALGFRHESDTK